MRALDIGLSGKYSNMRPAAPILVSNVKWWKKLDDPTLDRLMDRALTDNLSLEMAEARIEQARAAYKSVQSPVTADASGIPNYSGTDEIDPEGEFAARLGLGWILDPWGQRRNRLRALAAQTVAVEAEADAATLLMILSLGQSYVNLRYNERVLSILLRQREQWLESLDLIERLVDAGETTRLELLRNRADLANIDAQIPTVRASIAALRNEIAVLIGVPPGTPLGAITGNQPYPKLGVEVGVPADLLRNRPDIKASEWRYRAALASIDSARASLYPTLSLTGVLRASAFDGNGTSDGGLTYNFGPTLAFPTLPTGAARAEVRRQHAVAEENWLDWKATVLDAIKEVENALAEYEATQAVFDARNRALRHEREAFRIANDLFFDGNTTLRDLIDAQQDLYDAETSVAIALRNMGLSYVELNVRLGAGNEVREY